MANSELENKDLDNDKLKIDGSVRDDFILTIATTDREEDVDFIENAIRQQNRLEAPSTQSKEPVKYNLVLKDSRGDVVGGVITTIYRYSMYVETLWIDEKYRKDGYGTQLMKQAEETAIAHGCTMMQLDTFNYQAPEFYKKLGFVQFGQLGYKEGFVRYYFTKAL
ncbi:GNAT family N-acetyltransferase [Fusibacter bizertensis]